jgi:ankyrin repeat protein
MVYLPKAWVEQFKAAIRKNQIAEVQKWLNKDKRLLCYKSDAAPYALNHDNSYPLEIACKYSCPEIVDILLKALIQRNELHVIDGMDLEARHLNKLLEQALILKDYSKCELLLRTGADVEQSDLENNTLLHRLLLDEEDHTEEAITWVLEQKADLESCNNEGDTPLILSVHSCTLKLTNFLLDHHANTEAKNIAQKTALYLAVENDDIERVKLLLSHNASATVIDPSEQITLLHIAVRNNNLPMLELLLSTQAATLIDTQNHMGDTALHLAATGDNEQIITCLLQKGAYHKIENNLGQTPQTAAKDQNKPNNAKLIAETVRNLKRNKSEVIKAQATEIARLKDEIAGLKDLLGSMNSTLEKHQRGLNTQGAKIAKLSNSKNGFWDKTNENKEENRQENSFADPGWWLQTKSPEGPKPK